MAHRFCLYISSRVGPPGGNNPDWWTSRDNEKPGCGIYDDRYTFYLSRYQYDMVTNGDVYIHNTLAAPFPVLLKIFMILQHRFRIS